MNLDTETILIEVWSATRKANESGESYCIIDVDGDIKCRPKRLVSRNANVIDTINPTQSRIIASD